MNKEEKKRLIFLKKNSATYFNTLKATDRKHNYGVKVEFSSYLDLMDTINVLLKLCIQEVCYGAEGASPRIKRNPKIQSILELIMQLLPMYEAELLDEIRPILTSKKKATNEN